VGYVPGLDRLGGRWEAARVIRLVNASTVLLACASFLSLGAWLSVAGLSVAAAQPAPSAAPTQPAPTAAADAGVVRSEADIARRAGVYVRVGDVSITVGMIEDRIAAMQPFLRQRYRDPVQLRQFADDMVRFELMAQEAARRHYDQNPTVVRTLKQNAAQLLIRREFDDRITPETVSEADVRTYYDAHADEFSRPEMRRASHILVHTREEAAQLLAELRAGDARTFREAARRRSLDDQTKLRGGDLRFFTHEGRATGSRDNPVAEALVNAAFALQNLGDLSEPIPLEGNFSIVKLTGKRPAETRTLEQAGRGIRLRLWREQRQAAIDHFVDGLRQRQHPVVNEELVTPIHLDPAEPRPGFGGHDIAAGEGPSAPGMTETPDAPVVPDMAPTPTPDAPVAPTMAP